MQDFLKQIIQAAEKAGGQLANNPLVKAVQGQAHPIPPPVAPQAQGSLTPDFTSGQSAQLTPQVAQTQEKASTDTTKRIVNSPGGRFVQGVGVGQSPEYDPTAYQQQKGASSPEAFGALVGTALPALGIPEAKVGEGLASTPQAIRAGAAELKDAIEAGKAQPGGLQAGFINPREVAGLPSRPGAIVDGNGRPISSQPIEPQTGGKYVNETPSDLTGGTPAKVKAKASVEPDMQYVPGEKPNVSAQEPAPINSAEQSNAGSQAKQEISPSPTANYTRTHDVNSPDYTPSADDLRENTKRNLKPDGNDIRDLQEQDQVNATLNGYNIKGSRSQQFRTVTESIGDLANRAKAKALSIGGTINKSNLVTEVAKNLIKVSGNRNIDTNEIMQIAEDEINAAYSRVKGVSKDGNINAIAPDEIPINDMLDLKKDFSGNASGTFGVHPSTWTKAEKVARPARDAADGLIDEQYPEIAKLNNDMSDMYRAKEALRKGAGKEGDDAQKAILDEEQAANAPKQPFSMTDMLSPKGEKGNFLPPILKRPIDAAARGDKRVLLPLGGALVAGIGGKAIYDHVNNSANNGNGNGNGQPDKNSGNNEGNHGLIVSDSNSKVKSTDIPSDVTKIKPDASGTYTIKSPQAIVKDGASLAMDETSYTSQKKALQGEQGTPAGQIWPRAGEITSKLNQLEASHNLSDKAQSGYSKAMADANAVTSTADLLKDAPPNLLRMNPTVEKLSVAFDGKYAPLAQQIKILQTHYPALADGILNSATPQIAQTVLGQISNQIAQNYYQGINQLTGNVPGLPPPAAAPQGLPAPTNGKLPGIQQGSFGSAVQF